MSKDEGREMGWIAVGKPPKKHDDPLQLFEMVEILKSKGIGIEADLTVRQTTGAEMGKEHQLKKKDVYNANPPSQDMMADLSDLDNLNEPCLLHTMRMRFCGGDLGGSEVKSLYCSFIGNILVSVNPFAPKKAWVDTFRDAYPKYLSASPDVMSVKSLQPHPWSVADLAYQEMLRDGTNQAVLICGESGSGKTEATKFVLQYLIGKKGSAIPGLEDALMATSEPLESFGNAKTVNNDNSSRFAKCMQICFNSEGQVAGAEIQTSLLEKSRVGAFFDGERNFHILYMLPYYKHVKCEIDTSNAEQMLGAKSYKIMKTAKEYDLLKNGDGLLPPEGDVAWFQRVIDAFVNSFGYTVEEKNLMMDLLTAILCLGNVQFSDDDKSEVLEASLPDIHAAADCLQVDPDVLAMELCQEVVAVGRDKVTKNLNRAKAQSSRDAICTDTFKRIFLDIVARCNRGVAPKDESWRSGGGRVGVLDIFGFERMQFNSLEQLCINYTNEKLHQAFINEVFENEKRVYVSEGINPDAVDFTDNAAVLQMCSGMNPHDNKNGVTKAAISKQVTASVFGILDDVCKQESGKDESYCERISKEWDGKKDKNGPLFHKARFGMEEFTVIHFAGPVTYGVTPVDKLKFLPPSRWSKSGIPEDSPIIDGFTTKNRDKIPASLIEFLETNSQNTYFSSLCVMANQMAAEAAAASSGKSGKKAAVTIVSKFSAEIESFFAQLLTGSNPKFIRCINPKPKSTSPPATMNERYNLQRVLGQLKYTGILDTVRVRQAGYMIRKKYSDFAASYAFPCNMYPEKFSDKRDEDLRDEFLGDEEKSREAIKVLFAMKEYEIPVGSEVEYGKTMIFIKKLSTIGKLMVAQETMMVEFRLMKEATMNVQSLLQGFYWQQLLQVKISSADLIGRCWKGYSTRKKWLMILDDFRRFGKSKPLAEAFGRGFVARWKFQTVKQAAMADGRWETPGNATEKMEKRRAKAQKAAMSASFARFAEEAAASSSAADSTPLPPNAKPLAFEVASIGAALASGAQTAQDAAPKSTSKEVLKLSTRSYINKDLRALLMDALRKLNRARPDDPASFLAAAMRGETPAATESWHACPREDVSVKTYFSKYCVITLLKPALMACDKHRPDDPIAFLCAFVGATATSLV